MFSVIIDAGGSAEALTRTLAALVPAAVEGVVRDVHVLGAGADAARRIADVAGARYWPDAAPHEVVSAARAEWLLLLEAGARLQGEWMDAAAAHATTAQMPAAFRPEGHRRRFAWFGSRRSALSAGLLISKRQALANAKGRSSLESLANGLARTRLDAAIVPAD